MTVTALERSCPLKVAVLGVEARGRKPDVAVFTGTAQDPVLVGTVPRKLSEPSVTVKKEMRKSTGTLIFRWPLLVLAPWMHVNFTSTRPSQQCCRSSALWDSSLQVTVPGSPVPGVLLPQSLLVLFERV